MATTEPHQTDPAPPLPVRQRPTRTTLRTLLDRIPLLLSLVFLLLSIFVLSSSRPSAPEPIPPFTDYPKPLVVPDTAAMSSTEQTFIAIKPDGVQRGLIGPIISRFENRGFKLVAIKLTTPGKEHLEKHCASLAPA